MKKEVEVQNKIVITKAIKNPGIHNEMGEQLNRHNETKNKPTSPIKG
jgi:hypothetical protein